MCSNYHPYCGCFSFVNIYIVKFTKKGVPFCYQLTRLTVILCNIWGVEESKHLERVNTYSCNTYRGCTVCGEIILRDLLRVYFK